ncbi:DUF6301 family protein [Nocardia sp. NPDC004123]
MRIDFDRTAEIVRLAASFDWSWSEDDLDTFCETAGWTIDSRRRSGASITTDLAHDRSDGEVLIHDNLINDIHFFASDVVVESVAEPDQVTQSQFLQLAELLIMHPFASAGRAGIDRRSSPMGFTEARRCSQLHA